MNITKKLLNIHKNLYPYILFGKIIIFFTKVPNFYDVKFLMFLIMFVIRKVRQYPLLMPVNFFFTFYMPIFWQN